MIRDTLRAALAAAVLWPTVRPTVPAPPPFVPPPPPFVMIQGAPPPPAAGPLRRAIDAADRLASRFLPPL